MVGEKIRRLRKEKKLTLKNIVEATGLSIRYIPRLGREAVEPSLSSLRKASEFLGVLPYLLVDQSRHHSAMVKSSQRPIIKFPKNGILHETVSPMPALEYTPSPMAIQLQIGLDDHDFGKLLTHPSEEVVILLQGETNTILGEISYHLNAGDSLVMRPNMLHRTINTGETSVIGFYVMTPMGWTT